MTDILKQLDAGKLIIDIAMIGTLPDKLASLLTDIKTVFGYCEDEINHLRDQVTKLNGDLETLRTELREAECQNVRLSAMLASVSRAASGLNLDRDNARRSLSSLPHARAS